MKTFCLFLIGLFLFSACGNIVRPTEADAQKLPHKVEVAGQLYQFLYPEKAILTDVNGEGDIGLTEYSQTCLGIGYANVENFKTRLASLPELVEVKIEKNEHGENVFESWFLDGELVFYAKSLKKNDFGFIAFDDVKDQRDCVPFVDELFASLSSELAYRNDKFSYLVEMPVDFKVDYLENGLILKKWIEPKEGEDFEAHKIEIVIWPIENMNKDLDLPMYIGEKYSGYTLEGKDFPRFSGYFVDESSTTLQAKRHFFAMNKDGSIIYEAYMQVPSKYYGWHKEFFDKFIAENFKLI